MNKYAITVTRTGFIAVKAKSPEEAERFVENLVPTSDIRWDDDWGVTDVTEDPDLFDGQCFVDPDANDEEEDEFERRPMIEEEDKYSFSQSAQLSSQCGLIGYLRADMDTDGNGFFSSWNDYRKDLKTQEFKDEFDRLINSMREEGDILYNRKALKKFCNATPQARMDTEQEYFGIRVDTEKYAYLMRLNPNRGEYNLYCYCYRRDWLDDHIKQARRGIEFVDAHYNVLFKIPDGGKIKIVLSDGETVIRTCRFIDPYHIEVGDMLFHVLEFMSKSAKNGWNVNPYHKEENYG